MHDVDGPRHAVPLVGLGAGDDEEDEVDDAGEDTRQKRPTRVGTGDFLQRKDAKGEHGPSLARNHLLQGRIRGGDLGRVVCVMVVVVAAVILDEVPGSKDQAGCEHDKIDDGPTQPQDQINSDDGAGVDAPVSAAFDDADGFGDIPNEGQDELWREEVSAEF